jgi:hypothetical protein
MGTPEVYQSRKTVPDTLRIVEDFGDFDDGLEDDEDDYDRGGCTSGCSERGGL